MISKEEYEVLNYRMEELLKVVNNETPTTDRFFIELDLISDLIAEYEEEHYPIPTPTLAETIRIRMAEMNLNQKTVSELIGVSPSRVSEYLNGKSEPTLSVARTICQKLNISADIALGL